MLLLALESYPDLTNGGPETLSQQIGPLDASLTGGRAVQHWGQQAEQYTDHTSEQYLDHTSK